MIIHTKRERLVAILEEIDSALVAFSGGVDSSLLLRVARDVLGQRLQAAMVSSAVHPAWEVEEAVQLASFLGVPLRVISSEGWRSAEFRANREDRCYRCKLQIMGELKEVARGLGVAVVVEGTHAGDNPEDRPGLRALEELGIRSPLREAGLDKTEIREWARELGLPNWERPPMACLATRIPKGAPITRRKLLQVERAEEVLREMGFRQFRARHHGKAVRIEVEPGEVHRLAREPERSRLLESMCGIGFGMCGWIWGDTGGLYEQRKNVDVFLCS